MTDIETIEKEIIIDLANLAKNLWMGTKKKKDFIEAHDRMIKEGRELVHESLSRLEASLKQTEKIDANEPKYTLNLIAELHSIHNNTFDDGVGILKGIIRREREAAAERADKLMIELINSPTEREKMYSVILNDKGEVNEARNANSLYSISFSK